MQSSMERPNRPVGVPCPWSHCEVRASAEFPTQAQKTGRSPLESMGEFLAGRHYNQEQSHLCKISSRPENSFHRLNSISE